MTIKITQKSYGSATVWLNSEPVAIMERSPWTGEWCYGLRQDSGYYDSPFRPTQFKTAKAAAKVAVAAYQSA